MHIPTLALLSGCALTPDRAEDRLSSAMERIVDRKDAVRHATLSVSSTRLGVEGAWAHGEASEGREMTPDTPFMSASIGKLFTAATVLKLSDEGVLSLDDDITEWLDADLIDDLPVDGDLSDITVRRLLSHRTGLPDYFADETRDGAENVFALMVSEPDRSWTPESLLAYTAAHFDPVGVPGEVFHYADTNYDLLGLIVESATSEDFHAVARRTVLEPLSLTQTWYYNLEDPPEGALEPAEMWIDDHSAAGTAALSLDWAGGGLMTTTADLAAFLRGLQAGQPVALERFAADWTDDALTDGIDYGYGLWRVRPDGLSRLLSSPDMIGVSGSTGAYAYLVVEHDTVITGTFDQTAYEEDHIVFLVTKVLPTLDRVVPAEE